MPHLHIRIRYPVRTSSGATPPLLHTTVVLPQNKQGSARPQPKVAIGLNDKQKNPAREGTERQGCLLAQSFVLSLFKLFPPIVQ